MSELDESFAKLIGRQPSDAERQELYRIRDALDLQNNDALWLVLIALQYYHLLFQQFPESIKESAQEVMGNVQATAEATAEAASATTQAALTQAAVAVAEKVARHVAGKQNAQWIAACVAVVALCFGGGILVYPQPGAYCWLQ